MMPPAERSATTFLNVDLDLSALSGLQGLLSEIENSVAVLHQTAEHLSVELSTESTSLDETLLNFAKVIGSLSPAAKRTWNQCSVRRFDVGIQAGDEPHAAQFSLSTAALSSLAELNAELIVTVYACTAQTK